MKADSTITPLELMQLAVVSNNDLPLRESVDVIFMHAHNADLAIRLFPLAIDLAAQYHVDAICINGSDGERHGGTIPGEAWSGKDWYIRQLRNSGLSNMTKVICAQPAGHTLDEARFFLDAMSVAGYATAIAVSPAHHLPRVMLTYLKVFDDRGIAPLLWGASPRQFSWVDNHFGSQAADRVTGLNLIAGEHERIIRYHEQGSLAHPSSYFKYLHHRDGA